LHFDKAVISVFWICFHIEAGNRDMDSYSHVEKHFQGDCEEGLRGDEH
jgi:hypothetical protein